MLRSTGLKLFILVALAMLASGCESMTDNIKCENQVFGGPPEPGRIYAKQTYDAYHQCVDDKRAAREARQKRADYYAGLRENAAWKPGDILLNLVNTAQWKAAPDIVGYTGPDAAFIRFTYVYDEAEFARLYGGSARFCTFSESCVPALMVAIGNNTDGWSKIMELDRNLCRQPCAVRPDDYRISALQNSWLRRARQNRSITAYDSPYFTLEPGKTYDLVFHAVARPGTAGDVDVEVSTSLKSDSGTQPVDFLYGPLQAVPE